MTRNGIRRVRIPNPISDHGDRPLTDRWDARPRP
jgi:hypothetical protein